MVVQTLRRAALGIFGHRLMTRFMTRLLAWVLAWVLAWLLAWLLAWQRPSGQSFRRRLRHGRQGRCRPLRHRRRGLLILLLAAAKAHGGQPLQQRRPPLLRMFPGELAAAGANLVLRRHRQFVDTRHAHVARWHPLGLRRNECLRLLRFRSAADGRIDE